MNSRSNDRVVVLAAFTALFLVVGCDGAPSIEADAGDSDDNDQTAEGSALALSPLDSVADGGASTAAACSSRWTAKWGYKGILSNPYVKAEWTSNSCLGGEIHLEVRLRYIPMHSTSKFWTGHSGSIKAVDLWSEVDGPAGSVLDGQQIRFKRPSSTNWEQWCWLKPNNAGGCGW
jgi:hypothetical protein